MTLTQVDSLAAVTNTTGAVMSRWRPVMKFKVTELKINDEKTGKVTLEANDKQSYYMSMIFLYVPVAELPLYPFGRELELELPLSAVDKAIDEIERVVDSVAAENAGMTETQYRQAESLYLHGDLSGR
jgi:hypothetical protein